MLVVIGQRHRLSDAAAAALLDLGDDRAAESKRNDAGDTGRPHGLHRLRENAPAYHVVKEPSLRDPLVCRASANEMLSRSRKGLVNRLPARKAARVDPSVGLRCE